MKLPVFVIALLIALFCFIVYVYARKKRTRASQKSNSLATAQDNVQIYVGNLHYNVQRHKLKEAFKPFGNIQEVRIIQNNKTGRSKGFAFISFASAQDANEALTMHGRALLGRSMVVRIAKKRDS